MVFSIALAIVSMVKTDSIGYSPAAVSPDNIIASLPSSIALAISFASARVGLGDVIIDSNMCVAVITGLPNWFAFAIIFFWNIGTICVETSTPKSPLATMTPFTSFIISSKLSTPS